MKLPITCVAFLLTFSISSFGQDLLAELQQQEKKDYTIATFKATRIINGHSVEMKGAGELEFIISHRFGTINSGSYNLFGLDQSYIRIGLEYGITDRLGVGIGRSSFNKIYDAYLKYKLLPQSVGPESSPFTITILGSINIQDYEPTPDFYAEYMDRASYISQILIARKFSPKFSAQLTPTYIHINVVDQSKLTNDQLALGLGARYRITKSVAINAEYFYRLNPIVQTPYHNSLGVGLDIETGGHVFQLVLSNTQGMIERTFVTETSDNFFDGGIHFGFNITRAFQLKKNKH